MFFSLPKILALIGVVGAVWYGFRLLEAHRKSESGDDTHDPAASKKTGGPLDLEECSICRAWVAGEACERDACPYGGDPSPS